MTIKQAFEKLTDVTASAMKNPFFVMRKLHAAFADIADKISGGGGGSTVEVTQVLTSGTKIATITVDNTPTDLYAPASEAPMHNYSTDEQVVGKWIDNSDIYEKSIPVTNFSTSVGANNCYSGDYSLGDNIPNVSQLWFHHGYYFVNDSYRSFIGGSGTPADKIMELYTNYSRANVNGYVVVRYIKSTT